MYQVLARKWRPQNFDQLVGQPHVARTLSNAIASDRLAHAYIFAGLRGTGKTTVARILAKCLNCETGPTTSPCNACPPCTEIADSRAIDVLEIDAASRTKVEQTRELLEVVSYAPVRDRNKILIIDEAHMLSKASFNALLKTLEEPPPNVVFVLATTELQKILPTILSRCQVFEFRRVGVAEVAEHLRRICDDEGIEIPDAALERLARSGEGSVRDALSLLERAIAFCGNEIGDEDVLRMLGAVRAKVLTDMVVALAGRDAGAMLGVLDDIVDEGRDLVDFWTALVGAVRDLMLQRTLPDRADLLARPPEEAEALTSAARGLSIEDLGRAFQILADLEPGLKASSQPRFLFEATLIRLASLGAVRPIEEVLEALGDPPASGQKKKHTDRTEPTTPPPPAARAPVTDEAVSPAMAASSGVGRLLEAVRQARPMLAAMLEQAASARFRDNRLAIRFPPSMEAVKRQVEARESISLLRGEAERLAGGKVDIDVGLAGDETPVPADAPPDAANSRSSKPEGKIETPSKPAGGASSVLLDQARAEPGVQKLMDAFGAQVVEIRRNEDTAKRSRAKPRPRPPEDSV